MTMFWAEKRRFYGGYGGGGGGEGFDYTNINIQQAGGGYAYGFPTLGSEFDLVGGMTSTENNNESRNNDDGAESTSKDERERHVEEEEEEEEEEKEEWLQLSIGGAGAGAGAGASAKNNNTNTNNNTNGNGSGSGLVELELMPSSSNNSSSNTLRGPEFRPPRPVAVGPSFFLQQYPSPHHEVINNWAFRPIPISIAAPSSSSPSPSYNFPRPFQIYDVAGPGPGPGADFRVIQPPRRPHSGIWFMLQASLNQEKEPLLPQISKSYLRIKDGRMTIRLVIKYLVNKLSLENESEIEIRCKGQRLLPFLTLQHVRDNIWSSPRDFITLLPNSSTTHHIMVLHYARTNQPL